MDLNEYQKAALSTTVYPVDYGMSYTSQQLCGEAGEYAGKLAKSLRGDYGPYPEYLTSETQVYRFLLEKNKNLKELLIKELGDILWYVSAAANELGVSLETVAQTNLVKILERKQRGVVRGSGDER